MQILIDGYNLLNATGIPARGHGIGSLERARLGLMHFLARTLPPAEAVSTTVVFDARNAPPGLPRIATYRRLTIRYAAKYETADDLIEKLIQADHSPRQLTVVSSDHRIQRAARRRKARAVSSEDWYAEITRRRSQPEGSPPLAAAPPTSPLGPDEVAGWVEQFGGEEIVERLMREERASDPSPFPPGYGDDAPDC